MRAGLTLRFPGKSICLIALASSLCAQPTAVAAASATEVEIRARGRLEVCIWPDYYAISFRNPRNGQLRGIDIDIARALARELKVPAKFVDTSFARFMDDLGERKCDIAMFGIGQTPERAKRVLLTEPHLRSGIYAISTNHNQRIKRWTDIDREGGVVAVQAGTFMEPYMRSYLKNAKLLVVHRPATREEAVLSGRADVFITDYPYAQRMRFQHEWATIITPPEPLAETNYGFAVRKSDPDWLERINAFVRKSRKDGTIKDAAKAHSLLPIVYAP